MNRRILHLAIPSIVSNITVPLLGLVDVAITGHMGDATYMAAIAVSSMVFNIIYWLFSFLRFGTGGMTAQAFGAKSDAECGNLMLRSQMVCFVIALLLCLIQTPILSLVLLVINPSVDLLPAIQRYYGICIFGTFPSLAMYAFNGWLVGMQNTRLPMVISITQNIVNILLSYTFVYHFGMKIEGVALGTLIAQWCGAVMATVVILRNYRPLLLTVKMRTALKLTEMKRFFTVNQMLFLRTLFLVAVNLYFIVAGARGGTVMLAVNSIMMQMFILFSYVMDGFAFAAEALCGRYYGANDKCNFRLALRYIWRWALLMTALFTLAYICFGDIFVGMLTDEMSVREAASDYLPWAIAIPACGIAAFVWDGVFVGMTQTRGMLAGTFAGAAVFFLLYFSLYSSLGNHALWLAFDAYLLMRGLVQHVVYIRTAKTC